MKQIDIEDDLYKYILANIEEFGETPSQILRRLLQLPNGHTPAEHYAPVAEVIVNEPVVSKIIVEPIVAIEKIEITEKLEKSEKVVPTSHVFSNSALPEAFANGVAALFASETFQQESVITNKFKMMLTTMYFENRDAFIEASKVAKGRSRDYLGENLEQLLASDNQEEVDLLIASKPRDIPYTPFWVVTNANTGRKRIILTQVMASMGYPHNLIERIKEEI
ncbi:replication initiation regulator SeqA [Psychromonas sp. Urea-02u-13]|uniref:replication initiation regulator SeqA n=1 Tax=Psychromonas sp. Urea-02u-13 TaxID=2058326 RepID=UPI000C3222AA|nr:replication initiation regulator SeqA [Psychromonas sp. Urea-02u-13]PKG38589.1 replication initiation regulator SeqA [Psychromonas sp. Urea-02u-13]